MTTTKVVPLSLFAKLLEVRKSVPYLKKDAESQQFAYNASSQVLGAVRQKLDDLGVLLVTNIINKQVNAREKAKKDGSIAITYEVDLDLEFTWVNVENPEEKIVINWFTMGLDTGDNSKAVGKALTYAEKYFMLKQFNIATDKDDADAFQQKAEDNVKEFPDKDDLVLLSEKIAEFATLRKQTLENVHKALGIKDLNKLTFQQVNGHHINLDAWISTIHEKALKEKEKAKAAAEAKAAKVEAAVGA